MALLSNIRNKVKSFRDFFLGRVRPSLERLRFKVGQYGVARWLSGSSVGRAVLGGVALASLLAIAFYTYDVSLAGEIDSSRLKEISNGVPPLPEGELSVVQHSPEGELDRVVRGQEIVVTFSHPMVPLATLHADPQSITAPVKINPPIAGRFRWYGSRTAAFIPEKPLPPAVKFQVSIPAGSRSLNGMELQKEFNFTFRTPLLELQSSNPYTGASFAYRQNFILAFNYPVKPEEASRGLLLTVNGRSVPFRVRRPDPEERSRHYFLYEKDAIERSVVLDPASDFPRDARIEISSRDGFAFQRKRGENSPLRMEFRTYGPLEASFQGDSSFFQQRWNDAVVFNNPVKLKDARRMIHISPGEQLRSADEAGDRTVSRFSLASFPLKPETDYTVRIDPGLKDAFGNALQGGGKEFHYRTPAYRREFSSEVGIAVLEKGVHGMVPLNIAGIDSLHARVGSFDLDAVMRFADDPGYGTKISSTALNQFSWATGLDRLGAGRVSFRLGDLLAKEGRNPVGWYSVQLTGMTQDYRGNEKEQTSESFVQVTDMGMVVKRSHEGVHAWVHSLSSGKALKEAKVEYYTGRTRQGECKTDEDGHCFVNGNPGSETKSDLIVAYGADGDRVFLTGKRDTFSMWGLTNNFDRNAAEPTLTGQIVFDRKLYRPGDTVYYRALLAARGKGRLEHDASHLTNITFSISSSRGEEVQTGNLKVTSEGFAGGEFQVPEDMPTGHQTIAIRSKDLQGAIYDTFQVEEFKPARFSVETELPKQRIGHGTVSGTVKGRYLFGGPMPEAKVSYSWSRRPRWISFPGKPGYRFGDDDYSLQWDPPSWDRISGGEAELNAQGNLTVSVNASPMEPASEGEGLHRVYDLELEARVSDVDERSVTSTGNFTVYPGDVLPGIRVEDRYIPAGDTYRMQLIAVSPAGSDANGSGHIRIEKKEWKTVMTRSPGGTVQRKNSLVRRTVLEQEVALAGEPLPFEFEASEPGNYVVTLSIPATGAYTRTSVYAYGGGYVGWDFRNDDIVQVLADREEYRPGDTAKIMIQSPFPECTAVVTLEREGVLWQKSIHLKGNGTPIEIPITDEHVPDVFVGVMLIRPRVESRLVETALSTGEVRKEDLGRPLLKAGMTRLSVDSASRRIPLQVESDRLEYGPGDHVELTIRSEPGAEVVLSVADRAVLDLVNYHFEDPLHSFFGSWPLGVSIFDNRRSIIELASYASKGADPGGKGWGSATSPGQGGFDRDEDDGARKEFRFTAHWEPSLKIGEDGTAKLGFQLPHNLTTFRIQALAAKGGRYNQAGHEFQVRKPVVLRPVLPGFFRPGDQIQAGAVLTNQTGKTVEFEITMESDLLSYPSGNRGHLSVESGKTVELSLPVRLNAAAYAKLRAAAVNAKGDTPSDGNQGTFAIEGVKARIKLSAVPVGEFADRASLKDGVVVYVPVRESPPVEAFAIGGVSEGSEVEQIVIPGPGVVADDLGSLKLELSSTAMTGIGGAFSFFATNPYFCTEQVASAFMARLSAGELLDTFGYTPPPGESYKFNTIDRVFFEVARKNQNSDGGFRLWTEDSTRSLPYLTAHVVYVLQSALLENKRSGAGYKVPVDVYKKGMDYLEAYSREPAEDSWNYALETLTLVQLILSREDRATEGLENFLYRRYDSLSYRARARLALARSLRTGETLDTGDERITRILRDLENNLQIQTAGVSFAGEHPVERAFGSSGSTLAEVLRAFVALNPNSPLIPRMVHRIVDAGSSSLWQSSQNAGLLAYSLLDYKNRFEAKEPDFTAQALMDKQELLSHKFEGRSDGAVSKSLSILELRRLAKGQLERSLSFVRKGEGRLYYRALLSYVPGEGAGEPRDEGIELRREILPLSAAGGEGTSMEPGVTGDRISLKRGESYLVRLTVSTAKPVYHFALNDLLPATSEVVQAGFATEGNSYSRILQKAKRTEREDFFWWMDEEARTEYRTDRVVVTKAYLSPGAHEFYYLLRPLVKGKTSWPAARAWAMYEPEVFGRSGYGSVEVY